MDPPDNKGYIDDEQWSNTMLLQWAFPALCLSVISDVTAWSAHGDWPDDWPAQT